MTRSSSLESREESREEAERSPWEAPGDSRKFSRPGEGSRGTWHLSKPYPGAGCPWHGLPHLWHLLQVREGAGVGREGGVVGGGVEGGGRGATASAAWRVGEEPEGRAGAWRLASQA